MVMNGATSYLLLALWASVPDNPMQTRICRDRLKTLADLVNHFRTLRVPIDEISLRDLVAIDPKIKNYFDESDPHIIQLTRAENSLRVVQVDVLGWFFNRYYIQFEDAFFLVKKSFFQYLLCIAGSSSW